MAQPAREFGGFFDHIKLLFRRITAAFTSFATTVLGLVGTFDPFYSLQDKLPPLQEVLKKLGEKPQDDTNPNSRVVILGDALDLFDHWRTEELEQYFQDKMAASLLLVQKFSAQAEQLGEPPHAGGNAENLDQELSGQTTFISKYSVFTSDLIREITNTFVSVFSVEPLVTSCAELRAAMIKKALQQDNPREVQTDVHPRIRLGSLHPQPGGGGV